MDSVLESPPDGQPRMRVLACPAQFFLSDTFGSEATWSFRILAECSRRYGLVFAAYCGSAEVSNAQPGVTVISFGTRQGKTLASTARFMLRYFREGTRALRTGNFDVVHHMFPFGFGEGFNPLAVLDRMGGLPFIIGPIQFPQRFSDPTDLQLDLGMNANRARSRQALEAMGARMLRPLLRLLQEKTLRRADVLVFDGDSTRQLYLSTYPALAAKATMVIPHGIDTEWFRPRIGYTSRRLEVVTASYFTRRKAIDILIRAMPRIVSDQPDLKLRAIGKGPELPALKSLAESLGVAENVIFQGFVPRMDLVEFYSQARVYAQPSISETLPLAVLEALACGTPVVATEVGLMGEYFHGSDAVSLVPPKNPEALAEAILEALGPRGEARSASARSYAEQRHAWSVIAGQWRQVYDMARTEVQVRQGRGTRFRPTTRQ